MSGDLPGDSLLGRIKSPHDLKTLAIDELEQLAEEIRERLKEVVDHRGGHLASNLGITELTLALHRTYDFLEDRLVWDTSHQSYVHKIITGRNELFADLRQYRGCCGFASKDESPYDLFDAGHAGTSVSAGLGIAVGQKAQERPGRTVVVIGDASVAAGMALEGLNHAGGLRENLLVILNDNSMSIDVSVGGLSKYLNKVRSGNLYRGLKRDLHVVLPRIPLVGKSIEDGLEHIHDVIHHALVPGQIFEDFGFKYFGPIGGHDIGELCSMLDKVRTMRRPVLLHVITNKGHGYAPAQEDPIKYHASKGFLKTCVTQPAEPPLVKGPEEAAQKRKSYSEVFRQAMLDLGAADEKVHAITAAMPGGTGLGAFQKAFPDRYYDVGIAEQHGVTFASGLAFTGIKPVFAVYSTFLQRGFDQVVHDVCLQRNPVTFCLDRSGLVEDGPTHHGVFDISYLRLVPGMNLMAPADAEELGEMLQLATSRGESCAIRYPKCEVARLDRESPRTPVEWGKAEVVRSPQEITILAYGSMVEIALEAATELAGAGIDIGVVNMRFAKPVDVEMMKSLEEANRTLITLEEHVVIGGFGSAVLEAIAAEGLCFRRVHTWGVPDDFVSFGARDLLLQELRLDAAGIAERIREFRPETSDERPRRTIGGPAAMLL